MIKKMPKTWKNVGMIITGCLLYAAGMNWFVSPIGLFSGGCTGFAQLITYLLERWVKWENFNLYGMVYLALNIPLIIIAWKEIDKRFFFKTMLGVIGISLFTTIIPVASKPIVDDWLLSALVGGIFNGMGVGMILYAGGSSGGVDIIGVWAVKSFPGASVGKISMVVNSVLYICLLLVLDVPTMLYSASYLAFYTFVLDRMHYQNISVRLMIFTKEENIDRLLVEHTRRGVTKWNGVGAYTEDGMHVLVSCVSKYEVHDSIEEIHRIDPHAFVIADEHVYVSGNFEKRIEG